jgi:hypothetical protein
MNVPRALPLALLLAYAAPSALSAQDDRPRPESVQEKTELLNAEISKLQTRLAELEPGALARSVPGPRGAEHTRLVAALEESVAAIEADVAGLSAHYRQADHAEGQRLSGELATEVTRLRRAIRAYRTGGAPAELQEANGGTGRLASLAGRLGVTGEFSRIGDPGRIVIPAIPESQIGNVEVEALDPRQRPRPPLIREAVPAGLASWDVSLERLEVHQHQEKGSIVVKAGDEPYFVVLAIRARFLHPGSTRVVPNLYRDDKWANNIKAGQSRDIPAPMGVLSFADVNPLREADIRRGRMPELLGAVIIAMESDGTPWRQIDRLVERIRAVVEREAADLVESGTLDLDEPGPAIAAAIRRIQGSVTVGTAEAVKIWAASFTDPDDIIGAHFLLFAVVEPDLERTIRLQSTSAATMGVLKPRPLALRFVGDGADYGVSGQVRRR